MVITLAISSVLISIAYYGFFVINRQFERFRKRSGDIDTYRLLSARWKSDFDNADWIKDTVGEKQFILGCRDTLISYTIGPNEIIRNSPWKTDSFMIRTTADSVMYQDDTLWLVDGIRLTLQINGEPVWLSQQKTYSAGQIMFAQNIAHE